MKDYTISELIALGSSGQAFFHDKLGYTTANFGEVQLRARGLHVLYFDLVDDLQQEIPYGNRFKSEHMMSIPLEDFWATLESWPNREQRELEIMARKLAALDANLDQIQSAQVLAFVARLQPQIDEIRRMITHEPIDYEKILSGTEQTGWTKDDEEIPV